MILLIKSIVIGICAILPGVSGSVIAVSLGVYEPFINSISDIKNNKKFLIIAIIGILIGVYSTCFLLINILQIEIVYYILIGIILSEVPFIIKNINNKTKQRIQIIPCIISFFISLLLDFINSNSSFSITPFKYFIGGILFSFGKVFPGVSSSFFLLSLGIYDNIILLIMNPLFLISNFKVYYPFIIGTLIGLIIFIRLLKYLLDNKYRFIYSVIIGLMLSSVLVIIPSINVVGIILSITIILVIYKIKKTYE